MSTPMVTLKDGSQVTQVAYGTVSMSLQRVVEESDVALYDLVEKCKDASYNLPVSPFGDSKALLTKLDLIDQRGKVHDDVQKIVLNSIEGSGYDLKLVSPLQSKEVQKMK